MKDIIIICIIIIIYYKISYNDINQLCLEYDKSFIFNKFNSNYYNLFTKLTFNPISSKKFISILDKFDITEKDSFLDIGCGNGYNLLYVNLRYSFKKIIGLEIDEKTYKLCKHNIDLIRSKKIDIYNINAVNYKIPNDVNYIYLFNPFAKDYYIRKIDHNELASYRKIIVNIKNSYLQNPRKIIIIFFNITPTNDINKEILKLFSSHLDLYEYKKLKINFLQYIKYGIFTI